MLIALMPFSAPWAIITSKTSRASPQNSRPTSPQIRACSSSSITSNQPSLPTKLIRAKKTPPSTSIMAAAAAWSFTQVVRLCIRIFAASLLTRGEQDLQSRNFAMQSSLRDWPNLPSNHTPPSRKPEMSKKCSSRQASRLTEPYEAMVS